MKIPKLALLLAAVVAAPAMFAVPPDAFTASGLWESWPSARVSPADPWSLRKDGFDAALGALSKDAPGLFSVVAEGTSAEGRRLAALRLGGGPTKVLLWSQMHGDEPTATCALLDILSYLGRSRESGAVTGLFSKLTIYLLPMLNPDGAERGTRRNAQGIDINRDAIRLQTPEGRFLKEVRDRFEPVIGYNLHNQAPLTLAGKNGGQVALALLSVPFDEGETTNEGRRTTKRLAVFLREFLAPWASGRIARYDMAYTARAFGDSMTRWGTATLLIETGGWNGPDEAGTLVRLNFVALLGSLQALADGSLARLDPKKYDAIPLLEREGLFDLLVREAIVIGGAGLPPFLADVALNRAIPFGGTGPRKHSGIVDLGDLSTFRGKEEIDARGKLLVPAPPCGEEGWKKTLERLKEKGLADGEGNLTLTPSRLSAEVKEWTPERQRLLPGNSGALLLLVPAGEGRLRVEARIDVSGR
ncbi:MAG: M14 family zinc carboxypeptidase [Acidithiobacillales bacterium]